MKPTNYKVQLVNEYCDTFAVFDSIAEGDFFKWLSDNCWYNGETYWLNDRSLPSHPQIPFNSMGYVVKFNVI